MLVKKMMMPQGAIRLHCYGILPERKRIDT
jgi:hypothetical protein